MKFALYALQALLGAGAILAAIAFLGGLTYLVEAQRNAYSDMWSEILQIFRTESVLVVFGTSFLLWIGTVRTYMARKGKGNRENFAPPLITTPSASLTTSC